MSLKLNAFYVYTFDAANLSKLDSVTFESVAIPEDIGDMERCEGFIPVVGGSYAVKCQDGYFLRAARASKSLNKAAVKLAVGNVRRRPEIADAWARIQPEENEKAKKEKSAALERRINEIARLEVVRSTPQSEASYPILFDARTGLALICTSSAAQAQKAFMQLQTVASELHLKPVNATNLVEQLSAWVEGSKPSPAGLTLGNACELTLFTDRKKRIVIDGQDIEDDLHLRKKIKLENWAVVRLSLSWTGVVNFFINDELLIDGVRLTAKGEELLGGSFSEGMSEDEAARFGRAWIDLIAPLCQALVDHMEAASSSAVESAKALFEGVPHIFQSRPQETVA